MAIDNLVPRPKWDKSTHSMMNHFKRARPRSPIFSSDPIFSTDDDEPSSENYIHERQKKKVRGPWFCYHPSLDQCCEMPCDESVTSKRTFKKRFDSGIYLGSDGSDSDFVPDVHKSKHTVISPIELQTPLCDSTFDLGNQKIQEYLEEGNECIDLSSQGLTNLSNEAIKQLSCLIRVPAVTEGIFSALEPTLKIFLASNELKTLPFELFKLDHLQVLSLRGNLISEISPPIGNLLNLKELNLSQNCLHYLPFEILSLLSGSGHLESLSLHPNPFYQPHSPINNINSTKCKDNFESIPRHSSTPVFHTPTSYIENIPSSRWIAKFQASTEVRFIDINGHLVKGPVFRTPTTLIMPQLLPVANDEYYPEPPPTRCSILSRVPSLLETALAACAKTPQLPYLALHLPEDTPAYLFELLNLAKYKRETGDSFCTICGRRFIIPRTEWIEWWEISKVNNSTPNETQIETDNRDNIERLVPLIRRGCSWLCVPRICTLSQLRSHGYDTGL